MFPNYLEEARTHVAAQDQLEHGGGVAPGIARRYPRAPQDQVDLLQVPGEGVDPGMGGDGLAFPAGAPLTNPSKLAATRSTTSWCRTRPAAATIMSAGR